MKVKEETVILFTENMAALLKSGLPLQNAVCVCSKINKNKQNIALCTMITEKLNKGKKLSEILKETEGIFSDMYISLIRIGEDIGSLTDVFAKLSIYLREKKINTSKLKQALTYPLIVLFTALFIVALIMFFVFPRMEVIFEAFTEKSDKISQKLNSVKMMITFFTVIFSVLLMAVFVIFILYKKNKKIHFTVDKILFKIPLLCDYEKTICCSDLSFAMKLLCSSGIPFSLAMEKSCDVIENMYFKNALKNINKKISDGFDISVAFDKEKVFPDYFTTWLNLSIETGNAETAFNQIYEYYRNQTSQIISTIVTASEPVFICITGIIIFVLIGQFILPVFSLLGEL